MLARIAFDPPSIDSETLEGLHHAEETLKAGSKSFDVAKLAFGREMRIGLVAIYAWCRMTVSPCRPETNATEELTLTGQYGG